MGKFSATSSTVIPHPPEAIYDYVTDPSNWGKTYSGSGGSSDALSLPLKFGDTWSEKISLAHNTYIAHWTAITVLRPRKFVFQQVGGVGATEDGREKGVEGSICTIEYSFEKTGAEGVTLFERTLTVETPKGVDIPGDLLDVSATPGGIDKYHAAVQKALNENLRKKERGGGDDGNE